LKADGIEPVIKYREFTDHDRAHNDRLKDAGYGQRWMAETAFSAIKRTISTSVGARSWYLRFREMVLIAAVYNILRRLRR
jgi:IS5 family transposase